MFQIPLVSVEQCVRTYSNIKKNTGLQKIQSKIKYKFKKGGFRVVLSLSLQTEHEDRKLVKALSSVQCIVDSSPGP